MTFEPCTPTKSLFPSVRQRSLQRMLLSHPRSPSCACEHGCLRHRRPKIGLFQLVVLRMSEANLETLKRVHKSLARVVIGTHQRDHMKPVLAQLHWLPIIQDRHSSIQSDRHIILMGYDRRIQAAVDISILIPTAT